MSEADTKKPVIHNFGCRLNALDGDYIDTAMAQAGITNATVINSCAVTAEAVRQARQTVRREARANPERPIFVTGCAAQTNAKEFEAMPEVTKLIGNEEKLLPQSYVTDAANLVSDIMSLTQAQPRPLAPKQARARAFVQVQTGCDHRCTFCIIPFGRGNSRSTPIAEVVRDCQELVAQGHQEIVLTGVDMTSWGADIGEAGLGVLIQAILKNVPDLMRLRLSSVDAVELEPKLLDMVVEEPRVMPHLHLSLQAGDNMILKRMKRRHTREQAIAFCEDMKRRRPDIVFGADIIAGFPTETDDMFENSLRLVEECELVWLHVFPYSQRPGTPAEKMPQVSGEVIKDRAARLRAAGAGVRQKWLASQTGKTLSAIIEKPNLARSETFAQITFATDGDKPLATGSIQKFIINGHDGQRLMGDPI
ncbi:MAG: tRNA (N(6)-L-threonylcarbamoyladenosine(37)-C(2))-methylthiotransferase MtaB [Parvibaculales bacterium]